MRARHEERNWRNGSPSWARNSRSAAKDLGLGDAFLEDEVRPELAAMPKAVAYADSQGALQALADGEVFSESEEDRLYNVLYTFFSRYYRDGDFQPQQRRARDAALFRALQR